MAVIKMSCVVLFRIAPSSPERFLSDSSGHPLSQIMMIDRLVFTGRTITNWPEQTTGIEPVHPFKCGVLDPIDVLPRRTLPEQLGNAQTVNPCRQQIAIAVTNTRDRSVSLRFSHTLAVVVRHTGWIQLVATIHNQGELR